MVRIIHFRQKCIGCYACVEVHPDRWRVSRKDGKSVLVDGQPKRDHFIATIHESEVEANLQAARNCPVNVIRVLSS